MKEFLLTLSGAILFTLGIYAATLLPRPPITFGPVETIQGIPYVFSHNQIHVDEPLAHADVFLNQPVFAKELILHLEFIPTNLTSLSVGIRENEFWLSYPQSQLCCSPNQDPTTKIQATVAVPLTDKLQEPDQSLDLMYFAEGDQPEWELIGMSATVQHARPTYAQFKDYARAILKRERAL